MPLMFTYDCENASQGAPYGDAIFALPEAFFFGYSGAIFERLRNPFLLTTTAQNMHVFLLKLPLR